MRQSVVKPAFARKDSPFVRLARRGAACLLALAVACTLLPPAAFADDEILISTAEDWAALARNCSLDAWSRGKTVRLTGNLNLSGTAVQPIPSFGGTFYGDGFQISGVNLTASGDAVGLFRYVQEGAVVQELRVAGTIRSEDGENVGGLVGVNRGAVRECGFTGTVQGGTAVGGLVGYNQDSGELSGCVSAGTVRGVNGTGGVAGKNSGQILSCQNQSSVNVTIREQDNADLLDTDVLGRLTSGLRDSDADRLLDTSSDTGGVAGWSGGVVQSCTNLGTVGYPHVGYNVGGIVGRQSGYLDGCINAGAVYGRKDVGGIAGQAEPDVTLTMGQDALESLTQELDILNGLIDQAVGTADSGRSDLSWRLASLSDSTDMARDSSRRLANEISDLTNENVQQVNTAVSDMAGAMNDMEAALEGLSGAAALLESMAVNLDGALTSLADAVELSGDSRSALEQGTAEFRDAAEAFSQAAASLAGGRNDLEQAVTVRNRAAAREALRQMGEALSSLTEAGDRARSSVETIRGAFGNVEELSLALAAVGNLIAAQRTQIEALESLREAVVAAGRNLEVDGASFEDALEVLNPTGRTLSSAADDLTSAMDDLNQALRETEGPTDALSNALNQLEAVTNSGIGRELERAFNSLASAAGRLETEEPFQFTPIGEDAQAAGNRLYSSLSDLSDQMSSLRFAADTSAGNLASSLYAVTAQLGRVLDVAAGTAEDIRSGVYSNAEVIRDTSEEDVAGMRMGKLSGSRNAGDVEGDRNVGGIAGSVAIEYDLDPENDFTGNLNFGSSFETRAVVQVCRNLGTVTARKSCAGGVAGAADLGAVLSCENYGDIASTDGSYVGGIAGRSSGVLRRSWSKAAVSGRDYVGGIAGQASTLTDCRAVATVREAERYAGAVAGDADLTGGNVRGNLFLDTGTAGVDGVSYSGIAEPISYEALYNDPATPSDFLDFSIRLYADGEKYAEIPFQYGQDLLTVPLPPVPEKEGRYGVWPAFDTTGRLSDVTVEAVYEPWITLLGSVERDGNRSLALAEGQFTDAASLHAEQVAATPPSRGGSPMTISLLDSGLPAEASVPLRLLNPLGKAGAVYQMVNGQWRRRDSVANGQYLIIRMTGTGGIFCVSADGSNPAVLVIGAGVAGLVLLAIVGIARRRQRRRRRAES